MIRQQFIRFVIVGVGLNAPLYGAYLLLTGIPMDSRAAMTCTYSCGVLLGFVLYRRIIFRYPGDNAPALRRYIATYILGYAINFATLWILVEQAGIAHQVVQGGVTLILPIILFALQKYWVFPIQLANPAVARKAYAP